MTDSPASSSRAVLVHIDFRSAEFNEDLDEFCELVSSSGVIAIETICCHKSVPNPKYFIGEGKLQEIKHSVLLNHASLVIFNHSISPGQQRNLERELGCRVIDRVELILDIFAQRARSYEGKLQVELAQLQHMSTRLIRGWTHLERQKGGIGLRGPGETQLETDRRLIGKRIKTINARLGKVKSRRQQGAKKRIKSSIPMISLVGYTNAGKSTLFNRLTHANVFTADKMFATLDPTLRRCAIAPDNIVIFADTVGFIRHIPHDLINAFHATLEETRHADLLLHIIDVNDRHRQVHIDQVNTVIREIGAEDIPQIEIYNKIDIAGLPPRIEKNSDGNLHRFWLSAQTGKGIDLLLDSIQKYISANVRRHHLNLPATAGKLRARLFSIGAVREEVLNEQGGWVMEVDLETPRLFELCEETGLKDVKLQ